MRRRRRHYVYEGEHAKVRKYHDLMYRSGHFWVRPFLATMELYTLNRIWVVEAPRTKTKAKANTIDTA